MATPTPKQDMPAPAEQMLRTRERLSVIFGDPGRRHDPFGLVWAEWHGSLRRAQEQRLLPRPAGGTASSLDRPFIRVRRVLQFDRRPYAEVASEVAQMKRQVHPDIIALESNGDGGSRAIAAFRAAGLDVNGVACAGDDCSEETMARGTAYSKAAVIAYAKDKIQNRLCIWERGPNIGELQQQLREFQCYEGPRGNKVYARMRNRHDDMAMAFLGFCSVARRAEIEYMQTVGAMRLAAEQEQDAARRREAELSLERATAEIERRDEWARTHPDQVHQNQKAQVGQAVAARMKGKVNVVAPYQ